MTHSPHQPLPFSPLVPYYLAKARYAPLSDLPRYAVSALRNRVAIKLGQREHFDSWGPRFAGLDALSGAPLDEIVARQWAACVTSSDRAFANMAPGRVFQLRYEDFTSAPIDSLQRILEWLGERRPPEIVRDATSTVRRSSVGKGSAAADALSDAVHQILEPPMRAHEYWKKGD